MSRVPNIFHFVFGFRPQVEPFHLMHYLCLKSCLEVNAPDQILFHCQHEPWGPLWDRIKSAVTYIPIEPDPVIAAYRYADPVFEPYRYAHLADVARLAVLARYGGVYADMDTLFVARLPENLFARSCVMGHERVDWTEAARRAGGSLCNAWIMAEPGAAFIDLWRSRLHGEFDGSWNNHCTLLPYRLSLERPDWIHVEPKRSFFHFDWDADGIADIFERDVADLAGIHSIHLWSHMWWSARRRDTSRFHAGRLTPAYVRHSRSTYAGIARAFLPETIGSQGRLRFLAEQVLRYG